MLTNRNDSEACESEEALLKLQHVTHHFGGIYALRDVSFSLRPNELLGLIGPNGSGKTTVINLITKIYECEKGDIYIENINLKKKSKVHVARKGIARTFQTPRLFKNLTVLEHIVLGMPHSCKQLSFRDILRQIFDDFRKYNHIAMELLQRHGLSKWADVYPHQLPYGIRRLVEITRALAATPKLLLLDEPTAGLNEDETSAVIVFIQQLMKQQRLGILLVEHDMTFIQNLCDRIVVLDEGEVIADGETLKILQSSAVVKTYLGQEDI